MPFRFKTKHYFIKKAPNLGAVFFEDIFDCLDC
jgi:hypothetical protein